MEICGMDRLKNVRYYMPNDPIKLYLSLFWFAIISVPVYIYAGLTYLLRMRKDVKGKVILVRTYYLFNFIDLLIVNTVETISDIFREIIYFKLTIK